MNFKLVKEMYEYLDLFLFGECLVVQLKPEKNRRQKLQDLLDKDDFGNKLLSLVLIIIDTFQDELFDGMMFSKVWKKVEKYDRELILECLN